MRYEEGPGSGKENPTTLEDGLKDYDERKKDGVDVIMFGEVVTIISEQMQRFCEKL
ncbi:MAG TPA: hypothetical protein VIH57_26300 [Bacteroidales bacterium]